jgi:NAD(P)H-hydrate epimerase
MQALSRDQIRELERRAIEDYGVPEIVLMENAGRGAAELLQRQNVQGLVLVCCGPGNNGGDGLVIARHLDNRCVPVHVLQFGEPQTQAAQTNYAIIRRSEIATTLIQPGPDSIEQLPSLLSDADWIVDALFGTGLRGPLRPPFDAVARAINQRGAHVLAVDSPSGMDCDTGRASGACVQAERTATFMAMKKGFLEPEATHRLGQIHVVDIGVPRKCLEECLRERARNV